MWFGSSHGAVDGPVGTDMAACREEGAALYEEVFTALYCTRAKGADVMGE